MALLLYLLIGVLLTMTPNVAADECAKARRSANNCILETELEYGREVRSKTFCRDIRKVAQCLGNAIDQCPSLEPEFGPVKRNFDYVVGTDCPLCTEERNFAYECFANYSIDFERADDPSYRTTFCREGWFTHHCMSDAFGQCRSVRKDLEPLWRNLNFILNKNKCQDPCREAERYLRELNYVISRFRPSPQYCGIYNEWREYALAAKAECPNWIRETISSSSALENLLSVCNDTSEVGKYTFECPADNHYLFYVEMAFCNVPEPSVMENPCLTVTGEECYEVTAYTYFGYNEISDTKMNCFIGKWEQCKIAAPAWLTPEFTARVDNLLRSRAEEISFTEQNCRIQTAEDFRDDGPRYHVESSYFS